MKIIILLLLPCIALGQQTKGIVRDSITGKPIPYVNIWVEDEDISAMADSLGQYAIKTTNADKILVFSAAGYKVKNAKLAQTRGLSLSPLSFVKETIPVLKTQTQTLGNGFKTRNSDLTFGSYGKPWMVARRFDAPKTAISPKPILKQLDLYTDCHNNNMKCSLRFFEITPDGKPGRELFDRLVIFRVDRGRDITKIDLAPYGIRFPENGMFVAVSWMIIPQNVKVWYDKRPMQWKDYDPGIGVKPSDTNSSWCYTAGKWIEKEGMGEDYPMKSYRGKFVELAMQLTLSN